ncbi:nuclear transport factor 2 family protein [uncultured Aquimarina sp.]|uniref:nuclear transport factor 2 family protein n=1 Tax=uncultured Aquimarina sp. TaxID=575652 RepID=UPI002601F38E|nr:nuclear transport factor 2 family protein [uncultured Aquimarina sp.]
MKTLARIMVCIICLCTADCKSQTNEEVMENEIKTVVEKFVTAGAQRNTAMFGEILHPDFRVVVNRYPTSDKTTVISGAGYISLMNQKKIGGTPYKTSILHLDIKGHSATVIALLEAPENSMQVTFLLVKNQENTWQIISDLTIQNPNP